MLANKKDVKIDLDTAMSGKTRCTNCGRILVTDANFYVSNSKINKFTKRMSLCKDCLTDLLIEYINETKDIKQSIYYVCQRLDLVYLNQIYESSIVEAGWKDEFSLVQNGLEVWKKYIKTINSLKNYKGYTFEHGEQIDIIQSQEEQIETTDVVVKKELTEEELQQKIRDKQNREDIIRIVGYDPFINEREEDKPYFYSRLIDMLTEDVINDSNKLTSIISIIKTQKQIDKLDNAISELMSNPTLMVKNAGDIKSLSTTKKDLQKSVLDTAKDNRISDLYSGQKTVGANTLSGISKKLKELDLTEAQVNLYDIQTSKGMQQVAYLSNKAINDQLMFAENEYADMVAWQREKVQFYEKEYKKLAEENRKLKVLCNTNDIDYKGEVFQEATYEEDLNYDKEVVTDLKQKEEEFNEIVESVLPMDTITYADKIIKEKEDSEKKKLLESLEQGGV